MAEHHFQVIIHDSSGIPRHDVVNVLYFETNAPDTIEGTCDGINDAYFDILNGTLADTVNGMTIKVYNPGQGGPVFSKDYSNITGGSGTGPMEVAICLSYAATDEFSDANARHRGRIFIGPLEPAAMGTYDVTSTLRDLILDFGERLASIGTAGNTTWKMYSRANNARYKIESISCDNAWDTQRRRGFDATIRESRDVQ